ncbi:uncharacterized protein LOC113503829 isoform X2 [Trichoplusia ni]|uniref:Uncharacterized protein LOC113503829 isoform X2 n=1 Tax=Trichoplusia ni TaxID=7111 RepID=A0A7E5WM21_TRINI|nr:uncharacterized protein LOC113503829 isoform X2 [Trichoplusia ni]
MDPNQSFLFFSYQRPEQFDMENASTEELMDEIIRITVFDYKALCAKMANAPIPESERELVNYMRAKYAMESKLVDGYLNKLQETMRDTPPGYIHAAIKQREREIREKLRAG